MFIYVFCLNVCTSLVRWKLKCLLFPGGTTCMENHRRKYTKNIEGNNANLDEYINIVFSITILWEAAGLDPTFFSLSFPVFLTCGCLSLLYCVGSRKITWRACQEAWWKGASSYHSNLSQRAERSGCWQTTSKPNAEPINFLCFFFSMNYFRYYSDVANHEVMFFIFIIVELTSLLCLVTDIYLFNLLN